MKKGDRKMDEETKAMLALYAGLAMHALISKNSHSNPEANPQKLAQRSVHIAEDLVAELEASFEGESMLDV